MSVDGFWDWLYRNDLERNVLDTDDFSTTDFLAEIFELDDDRAQELYDAMDSTTLSLYQLHEIFLHSKSMKAGMHVKTCFECESDFLELDEDCELRELLDFNSDSFTASYCSDCDEEFCGEYCRDRHDCSESEDEDDEEEEEEEETEIIEISTGASTSPGLLDTISASMDSVRPSSILDQGILSEEDISQSDRCHRPGCGHPYSRHSAGIAGKCRDECGCTNFITKSMAEDARAIQELMDNA